MRKTEPKILLVEDDASIRYVVIAQLKHLGYPAIDFAENGLKGVEMALAAEYDIIFMDIRLPELDGLHAAQRIRAAGKNTVIVGMTAFMHRIQCLEVGMNDFLQKPVLLENLKSTIDKWLGEKAELPISSVNIGIPKAEDFKQTELRLAQLKTKIDKLRERSKLDSPP